MTGGLDNLSLNMQLVLDLPFNEAVGSVIHDIARPHHTCIEGGTELAWTETASGLSVLEFDDPSWLECSAADTVDLDFTTGDFSCCVWFYANGATIGSEDWIIRGYDFAPFDGWIFGVWGNYRISFDTMSGGTYWVTAGPINSAVVNVWTFAGMTRAGLVGLIYKNGVDITDISDGHPTITSSARKLHIGCADDEGSSMWDGLLYRPRVWSRCLTAEEMMFIFESERSLFGV